MRSLPTSAADEDGIGCLAGPQLNLQPAEAAEKQPYVHAEEGNRRPPAAGPVQRQPYAGEKVCAIRGAGGSAGRLTVTVRNGERQTRLRAVRAREPPALRAFDPADADVDRWMGGEKR